jgi:hypothetical protein
LENNMLDQHDEMHRRYTTANAIRLPHKITEADFTQGRVGQIINWCRDKLGGRDEDLVGAARWAEASRQGWSEQATYACLPMTAPGSSWSQYIHDASHFVIQLQYPTNQAEMRHSVDHAGLELELTQLVRSWFSDSEKSPLIFERLILSRPPDLRGPV